jgi:hypothetical protein
LARKNSVLLIEVIGTIFIILLGSALHFTYEWSSSNLLVGSFSAVNESVWEHLKLVFFPSLFWMFIAFFAIQKNVNNFFLAKAVGASLMLITIPAIFYLYTAFMSESLVIDIASFLIAILVGQFVGYRILKFKKLPIWTEVVAIAFFVIMAILFVIFTFYPPHISVFQDSTTGRYGA